MRFWLYVLWEVKLKGPPGVIAMNTVTTHTDNSGSCTFIVLCREWVMCSRGYQFRH